ncbi:hypothetical protein IAU59_007637 [Kwoniella sp. CBS 9459]
MASAFSNAKHSKAIAAETEDVTQSRSTTVNASHRSMLNRPFDASMTSVSEPATTATGPDAIELMAHDDSAIPTASVGLNINFRIPHPDNPDQSPPARGFKIYFDTNIIDSAHRKLERSWMNDITQNQPTVHWDSLLQYFDSAVNSVPVKNEVNDLYPIFTHHVFNLTKYLLPSLGVDPSHWQWHRYGQQSADFELRWAGERQLLFEIKRRAVVSVEELREWISNLIRTGPDHFYMEDDGQDAYPATVSVNLFSIICQNSVPPGTRFYRPPTIETRGEATPTHPSAPTPPIATPFTPMHRPADVYQASEHPVPTPFHIMTPLQLFLSLSLISWQSSEDEWAVYIPPKRTAKRRLPESRLDRPTESRAAPRPAATRGNSAAANAGRGAAHSGQNGLQDADDIEGNSSDSLQVPSTTYASDTDESQSLWSPERTNFITNGSAMTLTLSRLSKASLAILGGFEHDLPVHDAVRLIRPLSRSLTKSVYLGTLLDSASSHVSSSPSPNPVAVKIVTGDNVHERGILTEAKAYMALRECWGKSIPFFYGLFEVGHDRREPADGHTNDSDSEPLPEGDILQLAVDINRDPAANAQVSRQLVLITEYVGESLVKDDAPGGWSALPESVKFDYPGRPTNVIREKKLLLRKLDQVWIEESDGGSVPGKLNWEGGPNMGRA